MKALTFHETKAVHGGIVIEVAIGVASTAAIGAIVGYLTKGDPIEGIKTGYIKEGAKAIVIYAAGLILTLLA